MSSKGLERAATESATALPAMATLISSVSRFMESSNLYLSPESRVLDICSELGEVFDSSYDRENLQEEVGDLLYSSIALCNELKLNSFDLIDHRNLSSNDLAVSVGRLSKKVLEATRYGSRSAEGNLGELTDFAAEFAAQVVWFALGKAIDPTLALESAIGKYQKRLLLRNSPASA